MTQKYDENIGARTFASGGQDVDPKTYDVREGTKNRLEIRSIAIPFDDIQDASSDALLEFKAPDDGKITHIEFLNGTVAIDGSNGVELQFINKTNSDDVVAYAGFGAGTEAVKATDTVAAVAAHALGSVKITDTSTCNKDDKIQCTVDRDGTTVVGTIIVHYQVSSVGR